MPQIEEPKAAAQQTKKDAKKPVQHPDRARELIETIVFVVVLVLLLKLFITEAFVIPTGSMATTLLGIHKIVSCPQCGQEFPVNSHDEVEGNQTNGHRNPLYGFCCPNCRYLGHVNELKPIPDNRTGDRVLVLKPIYHLKDPKRGDVVVFKYPKIPQEKQTASNYIKRAEGFGGETIAIFRGDLYVTRSLTYPADDPLFPRPANPLDLWKTEFMYYSNQRAVDLFNSSQVAGFPGNPNGSGTAGFEIVRKGEEQLLADRRIVWDNDKQPKELAQVNVPPRWYAPVEGKDSWRGDDTLQPRAFAHKGDDFNWIRYRHLPMQWKTSFPNEFDDAAVTDFEKLAHQQPQPIDNFLGYNAGRDLDTVFNHVQARDNTGLDKQWVGDLILECEVDVAGGGEVVMELSKGVNRFQAIFGNGKVTLGQIGRGGEKFKNPTRDCKVSAGRYKLRFANVDCKLWVWVDGKNIDFGSEGDYQPVELLPSDNTDILDPEKKIDADIQGYVKKNDVDAPAGIGAKGEITVRHITLHRDIFYTRSSSVWYKIDAPVEGKLGDAGVPKAVLDKLKRLNGRVFLSRGALEEAVTIELTGDERERWAKTILEDAVVAGADIYYVQPGHTMCLGDNSAQSSDSRTWGTVPDRLMLGKAVFVFFPVSRVGFIK